MGALKRECLLQGEILENSERQSPVCRVSPVCPGPGLCPSFLNRKKYSISPL
jgi:hypothetical protein